MEKQVRVTCIVCPMGCTVTVTIRNGEIVSIEGNRCPRGADYAREEVLEPKRVVMTVLRVRGGDLPVVSVKTSRPVPKKLIPAIMRELAKIELEAPVSIGQTVVRNILGTGVDIVATRNIAKCRIDTRRPHSA